MPYIILLVILLIALLVLLLVYLKKQSKLKKRLKYFQDQYLKILKVDALDRSIVSPGDKTANTTGPRKIIVEVHEVSELTDKTYILDMDSPWTIGRKPGNNTICIRGDKTVSSYHCRLEVSNERLYLVDLGSKNLTFYKPATSKKNTAVPLQSQGYCVLTSGDTFYVGFTSFEVTVFDSNYGLV